MKFGVRKPSLKKSLKARTTGRVKRQLKKSVNPLYGKKGMGYINNPSKAVYNKIYHQTTVSAKDILNAGTSNASTGINNIDPVEHKQSGSIWDIFKLIYYVIMLIWYLLEILFFGAILVGIIYILIKIIF